VTATTSTPEVTPSATTSTSVDSSASEAASASTTQDSNTDDSTTYASAGGNNDQTTQQTMIKSGDDASNGVYNSVRHIVVSAMMAVGAMGGAASCMKKAREVAHSPSVVLRSVRVEKHPLRLASGQFTAVHVGLRREGGDGGLSGSAIGQKGNTIALQKERVDKSELVSNLPNARRLLFGE
jgi:hypothetical protein